MNQVLHAIASIVIIASLYKWGDKMSGFEVTVLLLFWILAAMVARIPVPATSKKPWKERFAEFNKGFKEYRDAKLAKGKQ
jgi:hypothetical protein